jgi:predicted kinase
VRSVEEEGDTYAMHRNDGGAFRIDRMVLHASIIEDILDGHAIRARPEVVFMAGGPASGKSRLAATLALPEDAAHIDVDQIRARLPEYVTWQTERPEDAARLTQRESSDIAKRALAAALFRSINVVFDAVGGDDDGAFSEKILVALAQSADVRVCYASCPVDLALVREEERFARTGRRVPEGVLRAKHAEASRGITSVALLGVSLIEVYETVGDAPILLASGKSGAGIDGFEVVEQAGYAAFLEKGNAS